MIQPDLDLIAELPGDKLERLEGSPNAYLFEDNTPAHRFHTVISAIKGTSNFVIMVSRDFFDPTLALEIIEFVIDRKEDISLPFEHCILHGFAPSNYGFRSILFLGPSVNGLLHGCSENLQSRTIQAIPIYTCEFSESDTLSTIETARRYQVISIDWKRQPSPRVWIRYKNSITETIGKKFGLTKESDAIQAIHKITGSGQWAEVKNYKDEAIKIAFSGGSFSVQRGPEQSFRVESAEMEDWFHNYLCPDLPLGFNPVSLLNSAGTHTSETIPIAPVEQTPEVAAVTADELATEIYPLVWSGFYSQTRVFEIVTEDWYTAAEMDHVVARMVIESEFTKKAEAELSWPDVTDCDRLDEGFDDMNRSGLIALQYAGTENSDGETYVAEFFEERGGEEAGFEGYCFYHAQDLDLILERPSLTISYGDFDDVKDKAAEIAHRIVSRLQSHGLQASWSGNVTEKIEIQNILWQRRLSAEPHPWDTGFTRDLD